MGIERAILLIADIGGYTRFMNVNRMNLAHAQDAVAKLLEAVIDAAGFLQLAKLEGDAAFFYATAKDKGRLDEVGRRVAEIRSSFVRAKYKFEADRSCTCDGCTQVKDLNLKFVAHEGDVAFQRVKHLTELAGVDVILVHRMLKNDVPVKEYVLMSPQVVEKIDPEIRRFAKPLEHDFEGLGKVTTHYVDMAELAEAPPPVLRSSALRRFLLRLVLVWQTLPAWLRLKKFDPQMKSLREAGGDTPLLPHPHDH